MLVLRGGLCVEPRASECNDGTEHGLRGEDLVEEED